MSTWADLWPNHCRACRGWGGATSYQSQPYGMGSVQESFFDPCGAIDNPLTCHRCGAPGLSEDSDGPCGACGWNYDDGEPEPEEVEEGA